MLKYIKFKLFLPIFLFDFDVVVEGFEIQFDLLFYAW